MSDGEEPRRPRNMQGLLHFCTKMTIKEDAPANATPTVMDPERQEFLRKVMSNLCMDHTKLMASKFEILAYSDNLHDPMGDVYDEEFALESLMEIVHDIDCANDLWKMGGIPVLQTCFNSVHPSIIELTCEVVGVMCQNNPKAQDALLEAGIMKTLLQLLDSSSTIGVRAKAMYGLSCMVRGHDESMEAFDKLDGFSHLMRIMEASNDKLFVKGIFLITALLDQYRPTAEQLLSMGYTELLVNYLCSGDLKSGTTTTTTNNSNSSSSGGTSSETEEAAASEVLASNVCKEHCTAALLKLCSVSDEARHACFSNEVLKQQLKDRLQEIKQIEEHQEESDYITELLKLLYEPDNVTRDGTEEANSR